jgi:hypothetical protein
VKINPPKAGMVIRVAAGVDLIIAAVIAQSRFLAARVGRPATLVVAGVLFLGAITLLAIANRFDDRRA